MRQLTLTTILAFAIAPTLAAQTPAAPSAPRIGIIAGANLATLGGDDIDGTDAKNKAGFVGGIVANFGFAPNFAFQPELTFSMKGAKFDDAGSELKGKLNYVELPLLVRFDVPTSGPVKPFVLAGPALALQASCKLSGSDEGVTVSFDCKDFAEQADAPEFDPKTFDVGAMFGGGLAFDVSGRVMTVGVRYNLGLAKAFDADVKNRVLSIVGTFEFPILR